MKIDTKDINILTEIIHKNLGEAMSWQKGGSCHDNWITGDITIEIQYDLFCKNKLPGTKNQLSWQDYTCCNVKVAPPFFNT